MGLQEKVNAEASVFIFTHLRNGYNGLHDGRLFEPSTIANSSSHLKDKADIAFQDRKWNVYTNFGNLFNRLGEFVSNPLNKHDYGDTILPPFEFDQYTHLIQLSPSVEDQKIVSKGRKEVKYQRIIPSRNPFLRLFGGTETIVSTRLQEVKEKEYHGVVMHNDLISGGIAEPFRVLSTGSRIPSSDKRPSFQMTNLYLPESTARELFYVGINDKDSFLDIMTNVVTDHIPQIVRERNGNHGSFLSTGGGNMAYIAKREDFLQGLAGLQEGQFGSRENPEYFSYLV